MNTFDCEYCDKTYSHKRSLVRHIAENHNDGDNDNENSDDAEEMEFDKSDVGSERSNKDGNKSEDGSDEIEHLAKHRKIDGNYEAWKTLDDFINDPEKKLEDKYIIFRRLLIEAKNDTTFKATLDAINHFKKIMGLDFILISQCAIQFLQPMFQIILDDDDRDEFWVHFLQLPQNEVIENEMKDENDNDDNNVNENYLKLLMDNFKDFFELAHLLENDKFNKKIVDLKNKYLKKYEINEIDGLKRVVRNEVARFKKIEDYLNSIEDESNDNNDSDENNVNNGETL